MCHRRKLDGPEALVEEARRAGLDDRRFRIDLESNAILEAFGADLEETRAPRRAGAARALPVLRFLPGGGGRAARGRRHAYEDWRAAATAAGATPSPEPRLRTCPARSAASAGMATAELAAVCDLPGPRAGAEAWRLASEWRRDAGARAVRRALGARSGERRTASAGRSTATRTARSPRRAAHPQRHVRTARPARQLLRAADARASAPRVRTASRTVAADATRSAVAASADRQRPERGPASVVAAPRDRAAARELDRRRVLPSDAITASPGRAPRGAPRRRPRAEARRARLARSVPRPSTRRPAATRLTGRGPDGHPSRVTSRRRTRSARRVAAPTRRAPRHAGQPVDVEAERRHQELAVRGVAAHVGVVGEHRLAAGSAGDAARGPGSGRRAPPVRIGAGRFSHGPSRDAERATPVA